MVDAADSKSAGGDIVRVRVPPSAGLPRFLKLENGDFFRFLPVRKGFMSKKKGNRKIHITYKGFCIFMAVLIVLINILAWSFSAFCDAYVKYVFPILLNTWGRLMGLFPFAVGDVFLVFTVIWIIILLLMGIMSIFFKGRVFEITRRVAKIFLAYLLVILFSLTINWWLLYHTTSINETVFPDGSEYLASDLVNLYNSFVEDANNLVDVVPRDETGVPYSDVDINTEAIEMMKELSDTFSLLSGFYPQPKQMGFSAFFSQQYITGYYFPVTLEANINALMNEINDPFVTCHELAHLKGYIREDEANLIGILACLRSDNEFFRYSGLLTAIGYLENAINENSSCEGSQLTARRDETYSDDVFLSSEAWEEVEDKAVVSTDVVSTVSDVLVDTSLKVNGVSDGKISYNRVVELLLYYCSEQ